MTNPTPSLRAAGKFEAKAPFDSIVDNDIYYSVEAIRTIQEMEGLKINLYERVYAPANIPVADFPSVVALGKKNKVAIVTLVDRRGNRVNVPTDYLKSFPIVDGVSYERMCVIVDLGPCPPSLKPVIDGILAHFKSYAEANLGISDVKTKLGTIPTIGYLTKDEHESLERARANATESSKSDVSIIKKLQDQLVIRDDYLSRLEAAIRDFGNSGNP